MSLSFIKCSYYAYKTLIEIVFEDGIPVAVNDHSDTAEKLRESIGQDNPKGERGVSDIAQFIDDSFSLDYKTKAWWLSE